MSTSVAGPVLREYRSGTSRARVTLTIDDRKTNGDHDPRGCTKSFDLQRVNNSDDWEKKYMFNI